MVTPESVFSSLWPNWCGDYISQKLCKTAKIERVTNAYLDGNKTVVGLVVRLECGDDFGPVIAAAERLGRGTRFGVVEAECWSLQRVF